MARPSPISTQEFLTTCEEFYTKYGFLTYAAVGREIGLSRQRVHQRLTEAVRSEELSTERLEAYRSSSPAASKVDLRVKVSPDTKDFVHSTAKALDVNPATIVESALARYRKQIEESAFG